MLTFQFDLLSKPIDPIQGSLYELGAKVVIFFQKIISEGIKIGQTHEKFWIISFK